MMDFASARTSSILLALAAMALAVGIASAFLAWKLASLPFGMSAIVLLLSAPAIAVVANLVRRDRWTLMPEMPVDRLADGLHLVDRSLNAIRVARATVFVGVSYAVVMWFCQVSGMISAPNFVWFLTIACALAAAGYLPWLSRNEKQVREVREDFRRTLSELKSARGWN